MLLMLQLIVRIDKNIIEVGSAKIIKVVEKDVIHISLVSCGSIGKSKGNNLILVAAVAGPECGQIFRFRVYLYSVECLPYIQFSENPSFPNAGQGFIQ